MTNAARRTVVVANDVGVTSQHFKGLNTEISSRVSRSQHEAPAVYTEAAGNQFADRGQLRLPACNTFCRAGGSAKARLSRWLLPVAVTSLMATGGYADVSFEQTGGGVRVVIENRETSTSEIRDYTFDLPEGTVTVRENNTPNGNCWGGCPDTLEIIDWPPGFATVPGDMIEVEEGASGEILILPVGIS